MRLRRPSEVPLTGGVSGIVFVLALINFDGSHMYRNEALVFGAWGVLYLIESLFRPARALSGTRRADPRPEPPPADRFPDATGGARR
jgi:hypothetical protein